MKCAKILKGRFQSEKPWHPGRIEHNIPTSQPEPIHDYSPFSPWTLESDGGRELPHGWAFDEVHTCANALSPQTPFLRDLSCLV